MVVTEAKIYPKGEHLAQELLVNIGGGSILCHLTAPHMISPGRQCWDPLHGDSWVGEALHALGGLFMVNPAT